MAEYIEIKIPKGVLYLTADEIFKNIPEQLKIIGLKRGKNFLRSKQLRARIEKADKYYQQKILT